MLQYDFNDVAAHIVNDHKTCNDQLELCAEGDELQLFVNLRDELRRARESYTRYEDETPIHATVLTDTFSEGTTLIVDSEGGDLLDELKQVDCAVEEGRFEFAFEVDLLGARLDASNIVGEVDERDNMDGKLAEDRPDDVRIEDIRLGSFFREAFNGLGDVSVDALRECKFASYLCSRNGEKADAHEHATDCHLAVSKFDAFQIQHAQAVSTDQAIER